ncbi:hypothetical protein T03_15197 [Trichinella britovi]|uniref:Uncharacterized protein n=1 Tax=Trichinella britovi TaxID=45882 RepID=A0A0V1CTS9_TRIBR|nr:hypothetical protein T06_13475 [Trichinella sp. T6]KRY52584.1 hypothetical protein T03_15197 [Trichinella britovi]KRZ94168.1 hypothetical protein T08_16787 [Trichinella sp. T8]
MIYEKGVAAAKSCHGRQQVLPKNAALKLNHTVHGGSSIKEHKSLVLCLFTTSFIIMICALEPSSCEKILKHTTQKIAQASDEH